MMDLRVIQKRIYDARGRKVMLDFDLAALYEVETRALNQAVKRNSELFPEDFIFRLTEAEWSKMSSQIVMTSSKKRPKTALPLAFTEHGVIMLANVLRSKKAKITAVAVVRAFVALKQYLQDFNELSSYLKELEKRYDQQFQDIYQAINYLIKKNKQKESHPIRKRIGFK